MPYANIGKILGIIWGALPSNNPPKGSKRHRAIVFYCFFVWEDLSPNRQAKGLGAQRFVSDMCPSSRDESLEVLVPLGTGSVLRTTQLGGGIPSLYSQVSTVSIPPARPGVSRITPRIGRGGSRGPWIRFRVSVTS